MKYNWLKKALGLVVAAMMCATTITGCASKGADNSSKGNGEVTIAVTSFADTLEPTQQYFSWVVSRYGVGETLVRFDENGKLTDCLAESWENSEDGKLWTFKIREGVKFSNGNEMTAESVKSSLERTFEMSERAIEFFNPVSMKVEGQNLIIETAEPVAVLP